jgi:hypothetical protein
MIPKIQVMKAKIGKLYFKLKKKKNHAASKGTM